MASDGKGGKDIAFGPFRVDRLGRSLTRDGRPVPMGARAFDVLVVLAAAVGETVSKDALLDQAWPGLTVEENNLQVQISALRKTLGEAWIITVPGRGYRLTVPPTDEERLPRQEIFVGKPSIAVLPFTNVCGDVGQEYFSDGITEDIITELSHNQSLMVIARSSSFSYKGRAVDVREVARDLGVRYVVEGSVRRDGNLIRIAAQLIDAETGSNIWAERFDRDLVDIFTLQDEIARAMVAAIDPAISQAERQRAMQKPLENLGAWEAYQRALWHWSQQRGNAGISTTREFLQQAVGLGPRFAPAHAVLAYLHLSETALGVGPPPQESMRLAEAEARTAIELDPDSSIGHAMMAWVFNFQKDPGSALEEAEMAIKFNSNDPQGHLSKGHVLVFSGRPAEARESLTTALRLDPRGPTAPAVMIHRAIGCYLERDYLAAEAMARRAIRAYPENPRPYPWLVAALGQFGRAEEARTALDAAIAASPSFFKSITASPPPDYRPEDHEHLLDGLRKAGWEG